MSDQKTPTGPRFKLDFSPTVSWPIFYLQTDDNGVQTEYKIMMRWNRPTQADALKFFEAQKKAAAARSDYVSKVQLDLATQLKVAENPDYSQLPKTSEIEERANAAAAEHFDPDQQLDAWWKGWRTADVPDLDPESNADRSTFLNALGMKAALLTALEQLMLGGRQKNWQPPPGR